MAKNFIQEGDTCDLPAPYAVTSGDGALIGALFGVALVDLAINVVGSFAIEGVFNLAKVQAQAWTVGQKIYWDNTAKLATSTATTNTLIGASLSVVANPSDAGAVRLNATV